MKSLRFVIFLAFFSLVGVATAADGFVERSYALHGHGELVLHVPKGWNDEVRQHPGNFPPTIVLSGFEGRAFVAKVTPLWERPDSAADFGTAQGIHTIVARAAHAAESESVEGKLDIVTVGGGQGPGYYFHATDRAPQPGDFKYMAQGAVLVGKLVCTFTILTDSDKLVVTNKILNMLNGAMQRPAR